MQVISRQRHSRFAYLRWVQNLALPQKVFLSIGMAVLTAVAAQVRIRLPFSPVPITGQVLAVLLAGAALGATCGSLSQILYVGIGAAGVPWFAAATGGSLIGPTGGYLIGFVPAAFFVGWFTDRLGTRRLLTQLALMLGGLGIIYLFGAIQFAVVMHTSFQETLWLAIFPFIPLDLMKALLAAGLTTRFLARVPNRRDRGA